MIQSLLLDLFFAVTFKIQRIFSSAKTPLEKLKALQHLPLLQLKDQFYSKLFTVMIASVKETLSNVINRVRFQRRIEIQTDLYATALDHAILRRKAQEILRHSGVYYERCITEKYIITDSKSYRNIKRYARICE